MPEVDASRRRMIRQRLEEGGTIRRIHGLRDEGRSIRGICTTFTTAGGADEAGSKVVAEGRAVDPGPRWGCVSAPLYRSGWQPSRVIASERPECYVAVVTAALSAMEPASPFSLWGLTEFICEAIFRRAPDEPVVVPLAQKLSAAEAALFQRLWSLAQPALAARNVPELRQALGDVALSPEYAQWEVGCDKAVGPDALDHLKELSQTRPIRPAEPLLHHLDPDVADLLAQAFDLLLEMVAWEPAAGSGAPALTALVPGPPPPAAELARVRRRVVLGDVVGADVSSVVLSSLRGQVAFLVLLCAVFEDEQMPNWKGIALGELAVAGMQSIQRLVLPTPDHINLPAEEQRYAAFKADLVARLMQDGDAP